MYRLAEETRRLVRDKNSAAAGTYFSNLSPFSFPGRWGDCGGWEQKGVCHFCHGGSRAASISALHPGCGGHAVSSGTEAFAFFLFLKKKIDLEKWHFYRFAPKLWSASWCKQHGDTYSCLRPYRWKADIETERPAQREATPSDQSTTGIKKKMEVYMNFLLVTSLFTCVLMSYLQRSDFP